MMSQQNLVMALEIPNMAHMNSLGQSKEGPLRDSRERITRPPDLGRRSPAMLVQENSHLGTVNYRSPQPAGSKERGSLGIGGSHMDYDDTPNRHAEKQRQEMKPQLISQTTNDFIPTAHQKNAASGTAGNA